MLATVVNLNIFLGNLKLKKVAKIQQKKSKKEARRAER
jgi:hypothetical protein